MRKINSVKSAKRDAICIVALIILGTIIYLASSNNKKEEYPKVKMMPLTNPVNEINIDGVIYSVPEGYTLVMTGDSIYGYGEKVIITKANPKEDLMDNNAYIMDGETYRTYPVTITPEVRKEKSKEITKSE